MFGNSNISKQTINLDCYIAQANEIGNYIAISGKNFYAPIFENSDLNHINIFFRVKYKKTKAAVSKDKLAFSDFLVDSGFANGSELDLAELIERRQYLHINKLSSNLEQYIVYFTNVKDQDLYEGYLVFEAPIIKNIDLSYSSTELKLIKYLKKILNV